MKFIKIIMLGTTLAGLTGCSAMSICLSPDICSYQGDRLNSHDSGGGSDHGDHGGHK